MKPVWILGCGPDAILAAHAAVAVGYDVRILAHDKHAQFIIGPDHLTHNIPGLCKEISPRSIEYSRLGERGSFGQKVYGMKSVAGPWDTADGVHPLYSLRNAYTQGWVLYHELIEIAPFDAKTIRNISSSDLVINTMPAPLLCLNPKQHRFPEREIWRKAAPVHGQSNRIVYASGKEIEWYCWSVIDNISTWLFPAAPAFLDNRGQLTHSVVPAPAGTNCDCLPDVLRIGRAALWDDLVHPHQAYIDTRHFLDKSNQEEFVAGGAA
jgi:hypothetical protein